MAGTDLRRNIVLAVRLVKEGVCRSGWGRVVGGILMGLFVGGCSLKGREGWRDLDGVGEGK